MQVFRPRSRRTVVRRPTRHVIGGLESLEGRQLMTTAPVDGSAVPAAAVATTPPVPTLYSLSNDALLSTVLYAHPGRMASQIAPDGAIGINA